MPHNFLYHGSMFDNDGAPLRPGIYFTGELVQWDGGLESNEFLYATEVAAEAVLLGFGSLLEKTYHTTRFQIRDKDVIITGAVREGMSAKKLEEAILTEEVFLYTIRYSAGDGWKKNSNPVNDIDTEWKTRNVIERYTKTAVVMGKWLKDNRYNLIINNASKHTPKGHAPAMKDYQSEEVNSLDLKHRMIVTESFNLTANIGSIKAKLGAVAKTMSSYIEDKVRPQSAMSLVNYSVALQDLQKVRYTDVAGTKITVPRGLKVPMHQYVESMEEMVIFSEVLMVDVLMPFNTWLALRVAAPESLADAATVTDLKKFKDHNIDKFKTSLAKSVDPMARVDVLPLNKVYPALGELQPSWNDLNTLISRYINTNPTKVVKLVQDISSKVNRLIDLIDERGDEIKLNQQTITILSGMCWKMAEEVEFYGVLGTLLREASVASNHQAQEIKVAIKSAVALNKANKVTVTESFVEPVEPGFELHGKWFAESDLRSMAWSHEVRDVNIDQLAWALEFTGTPSRNTGFDPNEHVVAVEWDDKLYPLLGLDLLATVKVSGDQRVSCVVLDRSDLFPEGSI